ncbi:MAG: DUF3883 domain-containing protein [Gemmatimonadaceae bacterium]|nr:DUF3883 domain-containing protein [Gemmatimonadaceae bacterium]
MLEKELRGQPYNKTAHRRALSEILRERSDGSIERKHQNISSILIGLGYPYISGYKPLGNYQRLLAEVVASRVSDDRALESTVRDAVTQPALVPTVTDILERLEAAPASDRFEYPPVSERKRGHVFPKSVNYLELEARNSALGRAGEEFVLNFERARLIHAGSDSLAERVEHVAVTQGDGLGFDIRSFEEQGRDRFIEVKTTAYGKQTPFFISRNELSVSQDYRSAYSLYRLFGFRDDPRLYTLAGALDEVCRIEPVQFAARPA